MGAPTTSWFGGMFSGGATVAALGELATPLLVARSGPAEDEFARRMLVASDGLEESDQLIELAGRLAQAHGAGVTLLHVTGHEHVMGHESAARTQRIEQQANSLEQMLGDASDVKILAGSARHVVAEAARIAKASLVVMSSRRLAGPRAIGSVSRRVVHQADCSVLLIPPEHQPAWARPG